jgi:hypothetical protein
VNAEQPFRLLRVCFISGCSRLSSFIIANVPHRYYPVFPCHTMLSTLPWSIYIHHSPDALSHIPSKYSLLHHYFIAVIIEMMLNIQRNVFHRISSALHSPARIFGLSTVSRT